MKKIVLLCMAVGCGFFAIAEPYVPLPAVPMTPLRPTVEELNKANAEIARLKAELANKKPKEANPLPAPSTSADAAPFSVAPAPTTLANQLLIYSLRLKNDHET